MIERALTVERKPVDFVIHVSEMSDGDIAEIIHWSNTPRVHTGQIVQRYGDALVVLGQPSKNSFSDLFCGGGPFDERCRVELLRDGNSIEFGARQDVGHIASA